MVEIPPPVFGHDRERAARNAIAELAAAKEQYERLLRGWSDYDIPATRERYRRARAVRDQYNEYGDPA